MRQKRPRQRDEVYLEYIRGLPCAICGDNTSTEAAHLRMPSMLAGKRETGKGEKPDDRWALPLCSKHHRKQHKGRELAFWEEHKIAIPEYLSLALQAAFPDQELAEEIICFRVGWTEV